MRPRTKRLRSEVGFQNWELEGIIDIFVNDVINRARLERAVRKCLLTILRLFFNDDGFSICVDDQEILLQDSNNESGRIVALPLSFMEVDLTRLSRDRLVANLTALQFEDGDDLVIVNMAQLLKDIDSSAIESTEDGA